MKYDMDIHTHTIISGHAYTTLMENIKEASNKGIKVLGTSEHGPAMPGGPHIYYFNNMPKTLKRELFGVTILRGCEANIMDAEGTLDLPILTQKRLDYVIASFHEICSHIGNIDNNTHALLKTMDNPNVHIIGHAGNPNYPIWEEEIVKKAKEKDILIEINNSSFVSTRAGSKKNCLKIAKLCKEIGTKVIMNSDAHISYNIGVLNSAEELLKEAEVPEELIMNVDYKRLLNI